MITTRSYIIHAWQITASASLRESEPAEAAKLWKEMSQLCGQALVALKRPEKKYNAGGTPELYNLALAYKNAADKRYYQNLADAECAQTSPPKGLFPQTS